MSEWWNGEPWESSKPPEGTVGGHKECPIVRVKKICKQQWGKEVLGCGAKFVGWTFKSRNPAGYNAKTTVEVIDGETYLRCLCDRCTARIPVPKTEEDIEREALQSLDLQPPLRTRS